MGWQCRVELPISFDFLSGKKCNRISLIGCLFNQIEIGITSPEIQLH